jgi:hypothetical protein
MCLKPIFAGSEKLGLLGAGVSLFVLPMMQVLPMGLSR